MSTNVVLHLRTESAPLGHIAVLTPDYTRQLIEAGVTVHVERSKDRCYADVDYEAAGAKLVPQGSWPEAPIDHIIVGTKEPEGLQDKTALKHTHIYSGYYYKQQRSAILGLQRYQRGGGTFIDVGATKHLLGNKTDIFGRFSGIGSFAAALKTLRHVLEHPEGKTPMPRVKIHESLESLIQEGRKNVEKCVEILGRYPVVTIVGAAGRAGSGCLEFCRKSGIPESNINKWSRKETSQPGPYHGLLQSDVVVNCLYTNRRISPLIDHESLKLPRKLAVFVDVSCDYQGPYHAVPIYWEPSHFDNLAMPVAVPSGPPLTAVACNYYAAMVPKETSDYAARALMPYFLSLPDWKRAEELRKLERLFVAKCESIPRATQPSKL
ncbi:saccharopine dehydrogenase [Metarhizium album ARSEF 1941]|uniref:Saccharopine dehydrogenase [NAD(+), L-lysine-forming] n=1 Tax=Metarhizium album (strain ARSEF 1941) TaxID=1081103 RepID=A0A0B2WPX8_METAS|nr:saccharopine dehydrogenase [Metarhizium album ARSEF 1941]KHN96073.1 saccharopine dehydrogenase [Metarhizium album ARSEF 1941]